MPKFYLVPPFDWLLVHWEILWAKNNETLHYRERERERERDRVNSYQLLANSRCRERNGRAWGHPWSCTLLALGSIFREPLLRPNGRLRLQGPSLPRSWRWADRGWASWGNRSCWSASGSRWPPACRGSWGLRSEPPPAEQGRRTANNSNEARFAPEGVRNKVNWIRLGTPEKVN